MRPVDSSAAFEEQAPNPFEDLPPGYSLDHFAAFGEGDLEGYLARTDDVDLWIQGTFVPAHLGMLLPADLLSECLMCSREIIPGNPAGCRQPRVHFHMLDDYLPARIFLKWMYQDPQHRQQDVELLLAHNSALLFEAIKVVHKYECSDVMKELDSWLSESWAVVPAPEVPRAIGGNVRRAVQLAALATELKIIEERTV